MIVKMADIQDQVLEYWLIVSFMLIKVKLRVEKAINWGLSIRAYVDLTNKESTCRLQLVFRCKIHQVTELRQFLKIFTLDYFILSP